MASGANPFCWARRRKTSRHQLRLFGRFRLRDVDRQRVAKPRRVDVLHQEGQVEQRRRRRLVGDDPALEEVEPSNPDPDDGGAGLDGDPAPALGVLVGEGPVQRLDRVLVAAEEGRPLVGHRVLEVDHHPRRARVEHLHDQLAVVGRAGHLVPLVPAPVRQRDPPLAGGGGGGRQVVRQLPLVRGGQHPAARLDEAALPRGELAVELEVAVEESRREVPAGIEVGGRGIGVDAEAAHRGFGHRVPVVEWSAGSDPGSGRSPAAVQASCAAAARRLGGG